MSVREKRGGQATCCVYCRLCLLQAASLIDNPTKMEGKHVALKEKHGAVPKGRNAGQVERLAEFCWAQCLVVSLPDTVQGIFPVMGCDEASRPTVATPPLPSSPLPAVSLLASQRVSRGSQCRASQKVFSNFPPNPPANLCSKL